MTKQELEGKKVPELKDLAKSKGIANADSMKKDELVAAILGPENVVQKEGKSLPKNKVPGKYLKFNKILKGEN